MLRTWLLGRIGGLNRNEGEQTGHSVPQLFGFGVQDKVADVLNGKAIRDADRSVGRPGAGGHQAAT